MVCHIFLGHNGELNVFVCHNSEASYESLVGGLVAIFYFPIYWVSNHPN